MQSDSRAWILKSSVIRKSRLFGELIESGNVSKSKGAVANNAISN